jgi:hypothetical protein
MLLASLEVPEVQYRFPFAIPDIETKLTNYQFAIPDVENELTNYARCPYMLLTFRHFLLT